MRSMIAVNRPIKMETEPATAPSTKAGAVACAITCESWTTSGAERKDMCEYPPRNIRLPNSAASNTDSNSVSTVAVFVAIVPGAPCASCRLAASRVQRTLLRPHDRLAPRDCAGRLLPPGSPVATLSAPSPITAPPALDRPAPDQACAALGIATSLSRAATSRAPPRPVPARRVNYH